MTIKELCKKHDNCTVCPYLPICGDRPDDYGSGEDLEVTNAIIETAKALEQHCEDAVSREGVINDIEFYRTNPQHFTIDNLIDDIKDRPPVQPIYNTSEWCHDCKEYDHDKHCCPRFNKVIRNAVEEIKKPRTGHWIEGQTDNPNIHNILCSCCFEGYPSKGHANSQYTKEKFQWCPKCGAKMIEPQESESRK